ncbi:restriction endonuclease subunit S [Riemerella anatipestifer]|uniref:restriction endonuclease subunit S n=1 Tax=Riemerella anatipestifer TaxID=34085 RepID=UPI0030C1F419
MERVKLEELCEMKSGGTPRRSNAEYYGGDIPWCKISDIDKAVNGYIYDTEEKITEEGLKNIRNRVFKKDTLLLAMYGSVGKTAFISKEMSTNQAILGINVIDKNRLDVRYLKIWFDNIKEQLLNRAVGGTLQNISLGIVKDLEIPLPPLEEQKTIAEKLDHAQKIINLNEAEVARYDELTQALFIDMFGDPVQNPKGWEVKKLGDFGDWKAGGTPSRKIKNYFKGNIPWVSSGELNAKYISSSNEHISKEALENSSAKLIATGSLLLGMYDTAALKSSINTIELTCNQAIAFSKLKNINTIFVYHSIQYGKEHFKKNQRGVRQKNMNLSMIKNLEIPIPPITLQNEFAKRIEQIEILKNQAQQELKQSKNLFQSLLQESFKG